MSDRIKEIFEISKSVPEHSEMILWTHTFKAQGRLYTEKKIDGILTLTNVFVSEYFSDYDFDDETCGCTTESTNAGICIDEESTPCAYLPNGKLFEWLNIFEDQVIAFSFIK